MLHYLKYVPFYETLAQVIEKEKSIILYGGFNCSTSYNGARKVYLGTCILSICNCLKKYWYPNTLPKTSILSGNILKACIHGFFGTISISAYICWNRTAAHVRGKVVRAYALDRGEYDSGHCISISIRNPHFVRTSIVTTYLHLKTKHVKKFSLEQILPTRYFELLHETFDADLSFKIGTKIQNRW